MKRKFKKRQIKNKKKEGKTPTKFWVFISFGLIAGFLVGAILSGTLTGNILRKWQDDWEVEESIGTCTDTDGGFTLDKRGVCNDGTGILIDRCMMKGEHRVLFEYECIENKCVKHEVYCENYGFIGTSAYEACFLGACHNR